MVTSYTYSNRTVDSWRLVGVDRAVRQKTTGMRVNALSFLVPVGIVMSAKQPVVSPRNSLFANALCKENRLPPGPLVAG